MDTIRTITTLSPVPASSDVTPHGFTATASGTLSYAGPDDLRLTLDKYSFVWLFFPTAGVLVKIQSYGQYQAWLPTGQTVTVANEVGHIVQGVLTGYQLDNVGVGAATVNGQSLNAGFPLIVGIPGRSGAVPVRLDPVLVDATLSEVRAVEQR